jgi:hypothetical protein
MRIPLEHCCAITLIESGKHASETTQPQTQRLPPENFRTIPMSAPSINVTDAEATAHRFAGGQQDAAGKRADYAGRNISVRCAPLE